MKTLFLICLAGCVFSLLGACHSRSASVSKRDSGRDSSPIDSTRLAVVPTASPPLAVGDSMREAPGENYDTMDAATRSHFVDVKKFLDFIKRPDDDNTLGFPEWIKHFRIENIDSFLNFIAGDSLEIEDADADPGGGFAKYSRGMLRSQLTRRKGTAFDMIGVVSLHCSIPYPQYSHTRFSVDKTNPVPNLLVTFSEFVLYFQAEKGSAVYKLYRLESDHISDR